MTTMIRAFAASAALAAVCAAPAADARGAPDSFADLAERLLPTVVNISTAQTRERTASRPDLPEGGPFEEYFREFFDQDGGGAPRQVSSLGSGFIIDSAGLVVTNNHVIEDADEVTVILSDDTELPAEIVGVDEKTDLALLRVETSRSLPATRWGDSDETRVGDWILAIGNPFGLGGSVTAGIVSARARDINQGPYDDYLQTDASINRGNSGGPMFNLKGEVIGVNTAIFSPTGGSVGIGFAVPARLAEAVVNQLEQFGRTKRGWLGVRIQEVTPDIADAFALDGARGALVAGVNDDGPAATAGIASEDIILRFNDRAVDSMRALPRIVAETPIGARTPVEVWRDGRIVELTVVVGELEEAEASGRLASFATDGPGVDLLGMTLLRVDRAARDRYDLTEGIEGLVITDVDGDGAAAEAGLREGDVVLKVSQTDIRSADDLEDVIENARRDGRSSVLLLIERGGELRYEAVPIG